MSEYAEKHRRDAKAKAKRLAEGRVEGKVDASTYGPASQEEFGQQNYVKKPKRRAFKSGGKVEGERASYHAGKKPRAFGGATMAAPGPVQAAPFHGEGLAPRIGNRGPIGIAPVGVRSQHPAMNLPLARKSGGRTTHKADGGEVPTQRFDFAPIAAGELAKAGGLKRGGKAEHPDAAQDKKLVRKMVEKEAIKPSERDARACGGNIRRMHREEAPEFREGRARGGRTGKGKTNINIIVAPGHGAGAQAPGMGEPPTAQKPAGMPVPQAAPPQAPPQMPPQAPPQMPPQMPPGMGGGAPGMGGGRPFSPPMGRKRGGRTV